MMNKLTLLIGSVIFLAPAGVLAAPGIEALTVTTNPDGAQEYTMTLQVLAIMTALSLLPAFIMMMTSFTRIIIVLSILRQAIGLQQSPSNQILIGVSLFLSMFIMAPVFEKINEDALQPYLNEEMKRPSYRCALLCCRKPELKIWKPLFNWADWRISIRIPLKYQ